MIRPVGEEDWQLLRDVRLRALAEAPEAFLETLANAESFSDDHWRLRATPSGSQATFVVEQDGMFEGMVTCFVADDPANAFLVAMWVAPPLRGDGTARELVARVVEWARTHWAQRVLLTVAPDNLRAARLYEACGFVQTESPPPFPYEPDPGQHYYVYEL